MTHMKKRQKKWKKQSSKNKDKELKAALGGRNWVSKAVSRYLETTAAGLETSSNGHAFLAALEEKRVEAESNGLGIDDMDSWLFLPMEKLQLLDSRPSTMAELLLMVESCHERFSEDQIYEILALIEEHLPAAFRDEEEDGDEMEVAAAEVDQI